MTPAYLSRIVTDGTDKAAWMRARARGITATDVAKLTTKASITAAATEKLNGSSFGGNAYTDHGKLREPIIANWVLEHYAIQSSQALFHSEPEPRHLATPDGIGITDVGGVELCEIKTTGKPWARIPAGYLRQVYWQQYVLGAERTLLVWEEHRNFVPVSATPRHTWIDRDDREIARLVGLANDLIMELHVRTRR